MVIYRLNVYVSNDLLIMDEGEFVLCLLRKTDLKVALEEIFKNIDT